MRRRARLLPRYLSAIICAACLLFLYGCSSNTASSASAQPAAASLIGTWKSPIPRSQVLHRQSDVWLTLRFGEDGKLRLHYAPDPSRYFGMGSAYALSAFLKKTVDSVVDYQIIDGKDVRLIFDSNALTYKYEISGSKLLLTLPIENGGDGSTEVYVRQS